MVKDSSITKYVRYMAKDGKYSTVPETLLENLRIKQPGLKAENTFNCKHVKVKSKINGQDSTIPVHLLSDLERAGDVVFIGEVKPKAGKKDGK